MEVLGPSFWIPFGFGVPLYRGFLVVLWGSYSGFLVAFWGASGGKVLRERGPGRKASGKKARVKTSAAIDPQICLKNSFK